MSGMLFAGRDLSEDDGWIIDMKCNKKTCWICQLEAQLKAERRAQSGETKEKPMSKRIGSKVWIKCEDGKYLATIKMKLNMPGKYLVEDDSGYGEVVDELNMIKPLVKKTVKKRKPAKKKPAKKKASKKAKSKKKVRR